MTSLLLLVLLGVDPPPAASAPPALTEQRCLALELVALVIPEAAYRSGIEQTMDQMVPALEAQARAAGKTLPADFRQRLDAALMDVVPYEETLEWSAEVYAQRFTPSELRELIAFYKTPVGKKLASKLPEIMGESGKRMAGLMPERMPAAMRRHGLLPKQPPGEAPQKKAPPPPG